MKLDKVVPFGRSLDEYQCMFNLSESDLEKKIIGIADGPASFNAEMKIRGKFVKSVDPLYRYDAHEIEGQFFKVVDNIIAQVKNTPDDWVWSYHNSPEHLRTNRVSAFNKFVADFETGKSAGRYMIGELPKLAIINYQYDIALCSHFLFLYSEQLSYDFHREAVFEMLRVAKEIRIFPLLTLNLNRSAHLEPIINELKTNGFKVNLQKVKYELQKGGNQMLRAIKS